LVIIAPAENNRIKRLFNRLVFASARIRRLAFRRFIETGFNFIAARQIVVDLLLGAILDLSST
jgi:hypothetical protein